MALALLPPRPAWKGWAGLLSRDRVELCSVICGAPVGGRASTGLTSGVVFRVWKEKIYSYWREPDLQ